MEVFRITLTRYAGELYASGMTGRWNQEGEKVIYTAVSRSLACLESLVHKRGRGLQQNYRTMVIHIPDDLPMHRVELQDLPENWNQENEPDQCRLIGSTWYKTGKTPVLSVPSAVVPYERNIVIHAQHPDFDKIQIIREEPFYFDPRL